MERVRPRFGSALEDIVEARGDADVELKQVWRPRQEADIAAPTASDSHAF